MTHTPPRQTGRMTAILGVATVAATAAVISFSHVQALARSAGEPELTAWLLPLSIDGAIAAAAAVVLADSKARRSSTFLTWLMLALGLAASLAANIASAQPTWTARAIAAWPPIALALGIEVLASMSRRSGTAARPASPTARGESTPAAPAAATPAPTATPAPPTPSAPESIASPIPAPAPRPAEGKPSPPRHSSEQLHLVDRPAQPDRATSRDPGVRPDDEEAIEVIRRLDQAAGGQAPRRTIQDELGCGASRATRLAALARAEDQTVPENRRTA